MLNYLQLPQAESAVINILKKVDVKLWLQLTKMVLRHKYCTSELVIKIVETFDRDLLHEVDAEVPLMRRIVERFNWDDENNSVKLLASLMRVYQIKFSYNELCGLDFQDYYKVS